MKKGAEVIRTPFLLIVLLYQFHLTQRTAFPSLYFLPNHRLTAKIVKTGG
jgi:hypothetical protein